MSPAGFEPAKSRSEGGYPIHARLRAQKNSKVILFLWLTSKKFYYPFWF